MLSALLMMVDIRCVSVDSDRMNDDDDDTSTHTSRPGNGYRLFDGFTGKHIQIYIYIVSVFIWCFDGFVCVCVCVFSQHFVGWFQVLVFIVRGVSRCCVSASGWLANFSDSVYIYSIIYVFSRREKTHKTDSTHVDIDRQDQTRTRAWWWTRSEVKFDVFSRTNKDRCI